MQTRHARVGLVGVAALLLVAAPTSAAKPRVFKNCKAVDAVYPHGIAKNFQGDQDR